MVIIDRIEVDPEIMHGKPVVAGTRVPVNLVLGLLAQGISIEEIIQEYYPNLTKPDILACIKYAHNLSEEELVYVK